MPGCGSTDEAIYLGLAAPLSEARGRSMLRGAELAAAEINAAGGVRGRRIELVALDDSGRAAVAARVAQNLYDDRSVVAVVGHDNTGPTIVAAQIYNGGDNPLVQITPSASGAVVADLGPYSFRVCPSDMAHGAALAIWARQNLGAGTAAVLYENTEEGRGLSEAFRREFVRSGGRVSSADPYVAAIQSFEPLLSRIRVRGGADILLIAGEVDEATRVLSILDSLGINMTVLGGDGLTGIERSTPLSQGVVISTHYVPGNPGPRNEDFVSAFQEANGGDNPDHRAAGAYDIVHLLARAVEASGADRTRLREYLSRIGGPEEAFEGTTGRIAFDARGEVMDIGVLTAVVRGGRLVTAEMR